MTLRDKIKSLGRIRKEFLGASCRGYIRLTPKYSLKLYDNETERNNTFVRQTIAHQLGFGPKLLFKINKGRLFGYVTEHADT